MNEFYNVKLTINKQLSSQRLDKVLVSKLEGYSRTQIKTLILNGNVNLDEKEIKDPSYITKENENYFINIILKQKTKHSPENIDLNIIFEDEDLIVINKPPNLVMHPAPGNESGTLVNALMHYTNNQLSNLDDNAKSMHPRLMGKNIREKYLDIYNANDYDDLVKKESQPKELYICNL